MDSSSIKIIPKPLELKVAHGAFTLTNSTSIVVTSENEKALQVGRYLAERIEKASGLTLEVLLAPQGKTPNAIVLTTDAADDLGEEGYRLDVKKKSVVLSGQPAGLFYAVQTLFQLLPPQIYGDHAREDIDWTIPAVHIKDVPRFQWRGMHLDVCRHFYPTDFIKEYIDYLAMHKINIFHWHLTEDQGWRIEIKKYPKLTEISSWRDGTMVGWAGDEPTEIDNVRYGGYYTQEEIRDIVTYAEERFITIVPEIEMPGHSVAVLTAFRISPAPAARFMCAKHGAYPTIFFVRAMMMFLFSWKMCFQR